MCEVTTAVVATAGVISALGQRAAGQYERAVGDRNAAIARTKAELALQDGGVEEEAYRAKVRQALGSQAAAMAASGFQAGTGTFADLQTETAKFGEIDAGNIRVNAARAAWGLEAEADEFSARGRMAQKAGNLNSMGTLLTTGASAYKTWKAR